MRSGSDGDSHDDTSQVRQALIHRLSTYVANTRKNAMIISTYGILSVSIGVFGFFSNSPIFFGSALSMVISGMILLWMGLGDWRRSLSVHALLHARHLDPIVFQYHAKRIAQEITFLQKARTFAVGIFSIGMCFLVISCIVFNADALCGAGLALAIQSGVIGVIVMMKCFSLEIYLNEFEKQMHRVESLIDANSPL